MNIGYNRVQDPSRYGAIILAAGLSSRMNAFKPMLPVDGRPAVTGLTESLRGAGISDIIIVTGHQRELLQEGKENKLPVDADGSYYSILDRSFSIMNHTIAKMSIEAYAPAILSEMPFDSYTSIADYGRAREISERGRVLMDAAIDRYEAATGLHD